jgi:hypothetical protein
MKTNINFFLLTFALGATLAHGAVVNVGANQSIQTAINGAANGDTIVLTYPGQYVGNVTIAGKGVTIRSLNQALTSVLGNFSVSGLTAGQEMNFQSFNFSGDLNCSGSGILRIKDVQIGNSLNCSGLAKVVLQGVEVMNTLTANQVTDCFIRRSTITETANLEGNQDANGNATRLVVLQSTIKEKLTSTAAKSWIGYSNLEESYLEGTLEIVKNNFYGKRSGSNVPGGIGIDLNGTNTTANIHNNKIYDFRSHWQNNPAYTSIGIRISGNARANVFNNRIYGNRVDYVGNNSRTFCGMGIYVVSTAETKIFGNVFYDNSSKNSSTGHANIWAPAQNVTIAYNAMTSYSGSGMVLGGAENHAMVNSETGSNLVNKGHPDVTHQDFDGTRNDIGDTGGRNYIPNGTTTDKTIPISFSIAPQAVPVGGTVTIESTGATVK